MKATTWLCPILTLLCATRLVCTAQRGAYPLDYADSNMLQDDYLLEKRNKPSLSIVNPLDVLRQRLLLEIARRQMKENTRQVELNRAILKNVGKRMSATRRYQMSVQQQEQQQQRRHQLQDYFPAQLDYMPRASIFSFLQQPAALEEALADEKKSLDNAAAQRPPHGNEIGNETNHESTNGGPAAVDTNVVREGDGGLTDGLTIKLLNDNDADSTDDSNEGYQLRYLYRLHKNHFARK